MNYHINLKNSFDHIQRRIFTYYNSFGSHREPSSDCDHDLVMSWNLDMDGDNLHEISNSVSGEDMKILSIFLSAELA